jgi:hypothetical protein
LADAVGFDVLTDALGFLMHTSAIASPPIAAANTVETTQARAAGE